SCTLVSVGSLLVRFAPKAPDSALGGFPLCSWLAVFGRASARPGQAFPATAPNLADKVLIPRSFPDGPAAPPPSSPVDQLRSAGSPQHEPLPRGLLFAESARERRRLALWTNESRNRER